MNSSASSPVLTTRIGYLLNRTALQAREKAEAAMKSMGILPPHFGVLSTLRAEGPLTQRALGARLRVDPTTMVWLIDGLEKKGLARRNAHPNDRRAYLISLTAAGQNLWLKAAREMDRLEKQLLTPLSDSEQQAFRRLLLKLFAAVKTQNILTYFHKDRR